MYLVPRANGVVVRFDTSASGSTIGTPSAWSTYDVTRVVQHGRAPSPQFAGSAFDGRFVYFLPSANGYAQLVRYDTLSTFTADCAWSAVDLAAVTVGTLVPGTYNGAVFDGQYLYLIPYGSGLFARFQARTPASLPALPAFHGSFW